MTSVDTAAETAAERLMMLADDLGQRGFATQAVRAGNGLCLRVISREAARLAEDIYAAPARDGQWWFWWSWAEAIAGIEEVSATADRVAHVLAPHRG